MKQTSIQYAHLKCEKIETGPFTILGYFILEKILTYCNEQDIDPTQNAITLVHGQVIKAAKSNPHLGISIKNEEQIEKFIAMHDKRMNVFKTLCKNQLLWNASDENHD